MNVAVANSLQSYGAFEFTIGADPYVPDGESVLDMVAAAGYQGIDLGPINYLGEGSVLVERLRTRGLGLAGANLEFPLTDTEALPRLLSDLDAVLDVFDVLQGKVPGPAPRPTIADAGSDRRRASPGQSHMNPEEWGLDEAGWQRLATGLDALVARCRVRGYEPTFRHRTGSRVEAPWEIAKVLEFSDIGLSLDTGHFFIGGGDPVVALREWSDRISHVHLKDAHRTVMQDIIEENEPSSALRTREVFCVLGQGDVDCEGILQQLEVNDFSGWLVVEQEVLPQSWARIVQAIDDQKLNRLFLSRHGI
jgi:inosose dehydratase